MAVWDGRPTQGCQAIEEVSYMTSKMVGATDLYVKESYESTSRILEGSGLIEDRLTKEKKERPETSLIIRIRAPA